MWLRLYKHGGEGGVGVSHEGLILHVDGIITGVVTSHVLYILPRRVVQKGINITRQVKTSKYYKYYKT